MANMDYCRFTNTLEDLQDCQEHMDDNDLGEEEQRARERLIRLCARIADNHGEEDEEGPPAYDPAFGKDRLCVCGHTYYRHFDTYEAMAPVGCKYCSCRVFVLAGEG